MPIKPPIREQVEAGRRLYGTIKNDGNYLAECGHCRGNTVHDLKTHRCTICGAKNDAVQNASECDRCYKPMKKGEGTLAPDDQIVCDECLKKY